MSEKVTSILLCGVGGQGILRASDITCLVMIQAGYDVKKSEVHGMAQRGGCVTSHVRFGKKVYSPMARKGDIDILASFEKMETLRYLDFLKPGGKVVMNTEEIYPPAVNLGDAAYPEDAENTVKKYFKDCIMLNAAEIASHAGDPRTANTAILGAVSLYLDIDKDIWDNVLRESFPSKAVNANIKAFQLGREKAK